MSKHPRTVEVKPLPGFEETRSIEERLKDAEELERLHYEAGKKDGLGRGQAVDLLMLLSALEACIHAQGGRVPSHLNDWLSRAIDELKRVIE